jgi:hypothetical protein
MPRVQAAALPGKFILVHDNKSGMAFTKLALHWHLELFEY